MTVPVIAEPAAGTLDVRLTRDGGVTSVAELLMVWADHCPIGPRLLGLCRDCRHVYTLDEPVCPSEAAARNTLHDSQVRLSTQDMRRLSLAQRRDLLDPDLHIHRRERLLDQSAPASPDAEPATAAASSVAVQLDLFTIAPAHRPGGHR